MGVFVFLRIVLFTCVFGASVCGVCRGGGVTTGGLGKCILRRASPRILSEFCALFAGRCSRGGLRLVGGALASASGSICSLCYFPLGSFARGRPVSSSVLFRCRRLRGRSFLSDINMFCASLPGSTVGRVTSQLSITVGGFRDSSVPCDVMLRLGLIGFVVLFVMVRVVCYVCASCDLGEVNVGGDVNFSAVRVLGRRVAGVVGCCSMMYLMLLLLLGACCTLAGECTSSCLVADILFFVNILTVGVLYILVADVLIGFISLRAVVGGGALGGNAGTMIRIVGVTFSTVVIVAVVSLLGRKGSFERDRRTILSCGCLSKCCATGNFGSSGCSCTLTGAGVLRGCSGRTSRLCGRGRSLLYSFGASSNSRASHPCCRRRLTVTGEGCLGSFSGVGLGKGSLRRSGFGRPAMLIPRECGGSRRSVGRCVGRRCFQLVGCGRFCKVPKRREAVSGFGVICVSSTSAVGTGARGNFSSVTSPVVVISANSFTKLCCLSSLGAEYLFFRVGSERSFSSLLSRCNLRRLIATKALLAPCLVRLRGIAFILGALAVFVVMFVISLLFVLCVSGCISVFMGQGGCTTGRVLKFSRSEALGGHCVL